MNVVRITSVAQVVRYWSFFEEGIKYEAKYLRYFHPMEVYRKILCHLVYKNPKAWVGIVLDDSGEPVSFVMSHDVTPLFSTYQEFEISMFYYRPGCKHTIRLLQDRLDDYCRANGIRRYYLTTSSRCGSATKVFNDCWIGLQLSNKVFRRKVS
jgi:hypothetical protein